MEGDGNLVEFDLDGIPGPDTLNLCVTADGGLYNCWEYNPVAADVDTIDLGECLDFAEIFAGEDEFMY